MKTVNKLPQKKVKVMYSASSSTKLLAADTTDTCGANSSTTDTLTLTTTHVF